MTDHVHAEISKQVIGCAFEVHNALGPGFLESVYESALARELSLRGIPFRQQARYPIYYKNEQVGLHTLDLLVQERLIVELKAIRESHEVHTSILLSTRLPPLNSHTPPKKSVQICVICGEKRGLTAYHSGQASSSSLPSHPHPQAAQHKPRPRSSP